MTLRYTVETSFRATFTATKYCNDEQDANKLVSHLEVLNQKFGRIKYSSFILYDDSNNVVHRYNNKTLK